MKTKRRQNLLAAALIGLALVTGGFSQFAAAQDAPPTAAAHKPIEAKKPDYSPYAQRQVRFAEAEHR